MTVMNWVSMRSCFCCVCVHLSACACGVILLLVKFRRVTSESQSWSSAPRGLWSADADASLCAGDLRSSLHGRNRWTQSAGRSVRARTDTYPSRPRAWHQAHLVTHHQQMSSLALGHLQLWAPDEINDSLLAPCHGKSYATGWTGSQDKNLRSRRWGGQERGCWFTCQDWRWRSWLSWPSRTVWLPVRWRGCIAAQRHPEARHSYI